MGWRVLLEDLGTHLALPPASSVFLVGQLGKYLPGSVWTVVAQAEMGAQLAVPRGGWRSSASSRSGSRCSPAACSASPRCSRSSRRAATLLVVVGGARGGAGLRAALAAGMPSRQPVSTASPIERMPTTAIRRRGTASLAPISAWATTVHTEPGRYLPSCPTRNTLDGGRQRQVGAEVLEQHPPAHQGEDRREGDEGERPEHDGHARACAAGRTPPASSPRARRRRPRR